MMSRPTTLAGSDDPERDLIMFARLVDVAASMSSLILVYRSSASRTQRVDLAADLLAEVRRHVGVAPEVHACGLLASRTASSRRTKSFFSASTARSWCSPLLGSRPASRVSCSCVLVFFELHLGVSGLVRQAAETVEEVVAARLRRGLEYFEIVYLFEKALDDLQLRLLAADAVHGEVVRPQAAERAGQEQGQGAADEADAEQQFMTDAPARGHARPPVAAAAGPASPSTKPATAIPASEAARLYQNAIRKWRPSCGCASVAQPTQVPPPPAACRVQWPHDS